ncbi:MAG: Gldg family protein [Planctomycetota bacterium]
MTLRSKVILPIFRRNFASYFSGVLGYLFIVVFVVAFGAMAFNARFFTANEPSLDQLTQWYPLLLLFFIPAITMSVWADERKLSTDELLFTLPATDLEILMGKYLSVLAVYTVALLFSMAHLFVLAFLGNPDWGLICTTYLGYWLAGAALLSAGMVASILTTSITVAFVIGVIVCGIPVFIGYIGELVGLRRFFEGLSLHEQFRDFGMGVIPIAALLYFAGFTVFMLYLNLVLMTRRHWSATRRAGMETQYAVRTVSLAVVLICVTAWAGYAAVRVDATSEDLFSLSPVTRQILDGLEADRPIEIQAFLSPEVPREYVHTRKRLIGLLRQFDERAGKNVQVRYVDVTPFSVEAEEARRFGIEPVTVMAEEEGRRSEVDVYLGAVFISSYDSVVAPFFGKGLPIEYELTRSVQTVSDEQRYTVGILNTDASLMSGGGGGREWQIVTELKKQYNVEPVSPASEIEAERFDVLLAAMPSSLTAPEMENLVAYVESGKPVLVFDDPFPLAFSSGFGVTNAPRQPKPPPGGQMGMMNQQQPEQKADGGRATSLLNALGVHWKYDRVVFDEYNPHPELGMVPAEYVFVTRDSGNDEAFNPDSVITRELQELVAIYSGTVEKDTSRGSTRFKPLLSTGNTSGLLEWEEFVDDRGFNFMTMQMAANPKRNPFRQMDTRVHHLAASITSEEPDAERNAIFVADVDMISDFFFQERNLGNLDMQFDNVTFVLNAVDKLAGDTTFIDLRSRRVRHRTLTRLESRYRQFLEDANQAKKDADQEAEAELEKRREQLTGRVKEIEEDESLDPIAKRQMLRQAQEAEQQRLSLAEAQIEQRKESQLREIRSETERQRQALQSKVQFWAVWLPPIPAVVVGALVFWRRWRAEKSLVIASRRRD